VDYEQIPFFLRGASSLIMNCRSRVRGIPVSYKFFKSGLGFGNRTAIYEQPRRSQLLNDAKNSAIQQ
jgi:hypothetical protein